MKMKHPTGGKKTKDKTQTATDNEEVFCFGEKRDLYGFIRGRISKLY